MRLVFCLNKYYYALLHIRNMIYNFFFFKYELFLLSTIMSKRYTLISRKKLKKRARKIIKRNVDNLSNKALLKIVNRHNAGMKLRKRFSRWGKITTFTNYSEINDAMKLQGLSIDELKKLAKKQMIKNYDLLNKDQLYYVVISSRESPLEDSFIKYLNRDFKSDVK